MRRAPVTAAVRNATLERARPRDPIAPGRLAAVPAAMPRAEQLGTRGGRLGALCRLASPPAAVQLAKGPGERARVWAAGEGRRDEVRPEYRARLTILVAGQAFAWSNSAVCAGDWGGASV